MRSSTCSECGVDFCPGCGDPIHGDECVGLHSPEPDITFAHEFTTPEANDHQGADLLDSIRARLPRLLGAARRLVESGWAVRSSPQGLVCEPPSDFDGDVEEELAAVGIDDDLITSGLDTLACRSTREILEYTEELCDRVWYGRKLQLLAHGHIDETPPDILDGMLAKMREVEQTLGPDNLQVASLFDWGMIQGKLSALRWVLSGEWDNLDT